jgi:hypothetical protein
MVTTPSKIGSPYRAASGSLGGEGHRDPALTFGAAVLLLTSAVRLIRPVLGAEDFGPEPTLALLALLATGAYFLGRFRAWLGWARDR